MKYIRTNAGRIYDINEIFYYESFDSYYDKMHFEALKKEDVNPLLVCSLFSTKDIVKQADTIEELCDVFVFRVGECVIVDQDNDKFFRGNWKCYDTIYGAIWTDKGLIFVAKMNEKGELELL